MRIGLVISGSAHSLLLFTIIANGIFLLSDNKNLSAKNMDIYIISEAEFDAEVSTPPFVETDHQVDDQRDFQSPKEDSLEVLPEDRVTEIKQHQVSEMLESTDLEKNSIKALDVTSIITDESYTELEIVPTLPSSENNESEEKVSLNSITAGNEIRSLQKPSLEVPMARNEDRIDQIASDNKDSITISEEVSSELTKTTDEIENKEEETSAAESNKAATTEITPDGTKDVPIVVSGELTNSVIPPSRDISTGVEDVQVTETTNEQLYINTLVASLNENDVPIRNSTVAEISTMEKMKLRKSINQLLGRYWNKGILIGGSDFENYVIKIEILLDSKGNVIGDVQPIKPSVPSGRYAIAFREASNAIRAVGRIPLPAEKYLNGLRLKLTFDPASGIGFD